MQRYFIGKEQVNKDIITIIGDDVHHIKDVMRMKLHDIIFCCLDGSVTYEVEIIDIGKMVTTKIIKEISKSNELEGSITIAQGLIIRSKFEEVVRRLVEIGAKEYIPLCMKKSVVKSNEINSERLEKIVKEASEQSERTTLLKVSKLISLDNLIAISSDYDYLFMADANEKNNNIRNVFSSNLKGKKVLVVIGPESGYDDGEREKLLKNGFTSVNFGNRVLRTETAPLYITSVISFLMGDINA